MYYSAIPQDLLNVLLLHLPLLLSADVLLGLLVHPHGQRPLLLALLHAQVLQVLLLLLTLGQQLLVLESQRQKDTITNSWDHTGTLSIKLLKR